MDILQKQYIVYGLCVINTFYGPRVYGDKLAKNAKIGVKNTKLSILREILNLRAITSYTLIAKNFKRKKFPRK